MEAAEKRLEPLGMQDADLYKKGQQLVAMAKPMLLLESQSVDTKTTSAAQQEKVLGP